MAAILPKSRGPLSDLRVIDLSLKLPGAYCTRALCAFGADVIHVEAPGKGNSLRTIGPFYRDLPHRERSGLHNHVNCGKRSVTLDVGSGVGRRILTSLIEKADVIVEDWGPGEVEARGLGYEALDALNPRLVMTRISNFGRTGPYRDYKTSELILAGLSGPMYVTGDVDREPTKMGGRVGQFQAGMVSALLTMVAVRARDLTGVGSRVDLSEMETQAGTADRWMPILVHYAYTGQIAERMPGIILAGAGVVPTLDGYVNTLNPSTESRLRKILSMIGKPELIKSEEFADPDRRIGMVNDEFLQWTLEHSTQEAIDASANSGVMAAPVLTPESIHGNAQMVYRRPWVEVEHPEMGVQTQPMRASIFSGTPNQVSRPAPRLGEHNREVFCGELGYSRAELARLGRMGVV